MTSLPLSRTRRRLLAAAPILMLNPLLGGCGGGASAEAPQIVAFEQEGSAARVGERARLRVRFTGGAGRIEPGLGPVVSGEVVETPPLAASRRYRLIVSAPGLADATRDLLVPVGFRDRIQGFAAPAMAGHGVLALADGGALVVGGSRGESVLSSAIDRFDPVTRRLTRLGEMATGRSEMSVVAVDPSRALVFGGPTSSVQPPFAELIDLRTGAVSSGGSMMLPRSRHAALRLADGRVAAVGGANRNSIETWDPATGAWSLVANRMAHTREHATASLLPGGRVLIVGGYTPGTGYAFAEIHDPADSSFTVVPGAPVERRWLHAALTLSDGSVLIVGGENEGGALASVWRFDPSTQRFLAQPALTTARSVVSAVATPDDEVLVYGGEQQADEGLASGVVWRGGSQRSVPDMPVPRAWHSITRLSDGRVLMLGGQHRGSLQAGGELFD